MFDLITIGDATLDTFIIIDDNTKKCHVDAQRKLLCLNFGDKISLTDSHKNVGGNAANVAVGVRNIGLQTAILTELGGDMNGRIIQEDLAAARVDTSLITVHKGKRSRYSVILNYQSERTILSYYVKRAYKLPVRMPKTKAIYYTSLGEGFEHLQKQLMGYKKKHPHVLLAMNPGSFQMRHVKKFCPILPLVDMLFVNVEEAQEILDASTRKPKTLISGLHKKGVHTVILTDSTNGSHASDGSHCWFMPSYPIKPIARTGAGDAYASGVLAAIIKGKSVPEAMKWGTANAGGVIQKIGAHHGLLTQRGIAKCIKKHSAIIPSEC